MSLCSHEGSISNRPPPDLITCVAENDIAGVHSCLANGVDLNATTSPEGDSVLHWAVMHGGLEVTEVLLMHGADGNKADASGLTSVHLACAIGRMDICELLVKYGASVSKRARDGGTPLHTAANAGDTGIVSLLLDSKAEVNGRDLMGRTALHIAAGRGSIDVLGILINSGASVELREVNGKSALDIAALEDKTSAVLFLLHYSDTQAACRAAELANFNGATRLGATINSIVEARSRINQQVLLGERRQEHEIGSPLASDLLINKLKIEMTDLARQLAASKSAEQKAMQSQQAFKDKIALQEAQLQAMNNELKNLHDALQKSNKRKSWGRSCGMGLSS